FGAREGARRAPAGPVHEPDHDAPRGGVAPDEIWWTAARTGRGSLPEIPHRGELPGRVAGRGRIGEGRRRAPELAVEVPDHGAARGHVVPEQVLGAVVVHV